MKPFFLLLILIISGIFLEIISRPFGHLEALYQRLQRVPARFSDMRRDMLPAAGLFGPARRPFADDTRHPATQF